jgi:hypothetical protein
VATAITSVRENDTCGAEHTPRRSEDKLLVVSDEVDVGTFEVSRLFGGSGERDVEPLWFLKSTKRAALAGMPEEGLSCRPSHIHHADV